MQRFVPLYTNGKVLAFALKPCCLLDKRLLNLDIVGRFYGFSSPFNTYYPGASYLRKYGIRADGNFRLLCVIAALACIDQKVRLQQNLVIRSVNVRVGMMMGHQPRYALHITAFDREPIEKRLYQQRAFQLLIFAVRIAVFFPT